MRTPLHISKNQLVTGPKTFSRLGVPAGEYSLLQLVKWWVVVPGMQHKSKEGFCLILDNNKTFSLINADM